MMKRWSTTLLVLVVPVILASLPVRTLAQQAPVPSPASPVPAPAPPPRAQPVPAPPPAPASAEKDKEKDKEKDTAATVDAPVDLVWGFKIPLRDGVRLNGTVVQPAGQHEPLPVIFTLTPYIADSYLDRAMYFARHGYVFVLVDVRGRGNSGGSFEPFANEGRDGYDVVEYLARQPWSNGKVAMWGGSYAGFDQW